jgi:hypothetical protein
MVMAARLSALSPSTGFADAVQYAVYKAERIVKAVFDGKFYRFFDGNGGRDVILKHQRVRAQSQYRKIDPFKA